MTNPGPSWHFYDADLWAQHPASSETTVSTFEDTARFAPDAPCLHFGEWSLTFRDVAARSDGVAAALVDAGIVRGDRVAIQIGNDPQFVIAQLGVWKAGACAVMLDPRLEGGKAALVLEDCDAVGLILLDDVLDQSYGRTPPPAVRIVVTTGGFVRDSQRVATCGVEAEGDAIIPMARMLSRGPASPSCVPAATPDDLACVFYDCQSDGRVGGVGVTHASLVTGSELCRRWIGVAPGEVFLAALPLWDLRVAVAGVVLGQRAAMPIVLCDPSDRRRQLRECERWRCTFTLMDLDGIKALMDEPDFAEGDLSALTKAYGIGPGLTSDLSAAWGVHTGSPLHYVQWSTGTTAPTHAWPPGVIGPVDPATQALAAGIQLPGVEVRIVDPSTGADVTTGSIGELYIRGPAVSTTWWRGPVGGHPAVVFYRTGTFGKVDRRGWLYIVDTTVDPWVGTVGARRLSSVQGIGLPPGPPWAAREREKARSVFSRSRSPSRRAIPEEEVRAGVEAPTERN